MRDRTSTEAARSADQRTSSRGSKRGGLSVGYRDGRTNALRETERASKARRVKRGVLTSASAEDCAAAERVWDAVRDQVESGGIRADKVAAARAAIESGELDSIEVLAQCADALLAAGAVEEEDATDE